MHLCRGLSGEGKGEDFVDMGLLLQHQPKEPIGENRGLTRTSPGRHNTIAIMEHCFALIDI